MSRANIISHQRTQRIFYTILIAVSFTAVAPVVFLIVCSVSCRHRLSTTSLSSLWSSESKTHISELRQIPSWVKRYNVSHLFDWTWYKNGNFERCRALFTRLQNSSRRRLRSTLVVNDARQYFHSHPHEGCIVDDVARLPNLIPHPLPRARSLSNTCSSLHIDREWILCSQPQSKLDKWLPATKRFITVAVFNAFVDTGYCHSEVPGTVFTKHATFHFQRWTNNPCANDGIYNIPQIESQYRHIELIDTLGTYLQATGHFVPQQLPRLLRLVATVPTTAKILVAKGGVADSLIDVLIERGVVTRDRVIQFDRDTRPNHFANIVYRSESWPFLQDKNNSHYLHDRTEMQLVHRVLTANALPNYKKDRIILIKRKEGGARSIVEHLDMIASMISTLKKLKMTSDLYIEIFDARGHIRDHIALFRRARIIVGPHGAGMTNVLWASPGTHIIEVGYTTGMTFPEMYAEISLHLEHHYWICKGYGDYSTPIHVDMDDFMYIFHQTIHEIKKEDKRS